MAAAPAGGSPAETTGSSREADGHGVAGRPLDHGDRVVADGVAGDLLLVGLRQARLHAVGGQVVEAAASDRGTLASTGRPVAEDLVTRLAGAA